MTTEEIRSILTIALFAAYADSSKHERERDAIRNIAQGLTQTPEVNLPALYQDVLLKRTSIEAALPALQTEESRQLAYEMAVCVCDADGHTSDAERNFLQQLRTTLQLDSCFADETDELTETVAEAPLAVPTGASPATATAVATAAAAGAGALAASANNGSSAASALPHPDLSQDMPITQRRPSTLDTQAMDRKILRASILNGAIELLPESLSTMAIIPLQMRLVYQIGQSYGYELDKGHIRDFLATAGVGLTSQYLEQAGRKLLGGLLGKKGKGLLGGLGKQAISSGMSFASTYALGHVANQYYAGGRTISADMLKNAYNHVLAEGRQLHTQYLPDMRAQARTLDTGAIMSLVRGTTTAF